MYNNPYEEYMRNSLGYNIPVTNMNQFDYNMYENENNFTYNQLQAENLYSEIYRKIYPMICKACMGINEPITEDLINKITDDVYINIEQMENTNEKRSSTSNIQQNKNMKPEFLNRTNSINALSNIREETRQRNPFLRDLIRILVLRELLGNPRPPQRPPFRPPFRPFF